jgi:MoxR-like ATPase
VILDRTTRNEWPEPQQVLTGEQIRGYQRLVREVLVSPPVQDYAIRLVLATHPGGPFAAARTNALIRCGASPRGAQALVLAAKVRAMLKGTYNVGFEDVREVFLPALRHRILLSFEAQAENISADTILSEILAEVKERVADAPGVARK